jgi:glycerol-3-phosphate dehydrogenase
MGRMVGRGIISLEKLDTIPARMASGDAAPLAGGNSPQNLVAYLQKMKRMFKWFSRKSDEELRAFYGMSEEDLVAISVKAQREPLSHSTPQRPRRKAK